MSRCDCELSDSLWRLLCCVGLLLGGMAGLPRLAAAQDASAASQEEAPTRAERWRHLREAKAQADLPATRDTSVLERIGQVVSRTTSIVRPDQVLLDVPTIAIPGLRPAFGGLGSNADGTIGLDYRPPFLDGPGRFSQAQALVSFNRYAGAEALFGGEDGSKVYYLFGRFRHQPQEEFYGIGPDAPAEAESVYRLNEGVLGGLVGWSLNANTLLGSHLSYRANRYGIGTTTGAEPQVVRSFGAEVPGVGTDVDYLALGGFLEYDSRNVPYSRNYGRRFAPTQQRLRNISLDASRGIYAATEVVHHRDTRHNRYSFTRFTVDLQEYIPLAAGAQHGLALRQFASYTRTSADQQVPFYRLQTLGGSRSLRGYATDRFRDHNVFLVNAELRCHVWHWLDMAVFTDAGHVFNDVGEVGVDNIRYDVGVGFRLRTSKGTIARFEVARSPEGIRTHLKLGSLL